MNKLNTFHLATFLFFLGIIIILIMTFVNIGEVIRSGLMGLLNPF